MSNNKPKRIGILLADLGKLNRKALKFLVLHLNKLQQTFEYEILPVEDEDEFLILLSPHRAADRESIEDNVDSFLKRYKTFLKREMTGYEIHDTALPNHFILVTMARFEDRYYSTRQGNLSILALGNWKDSMAPPSIIEFIIALIMRQAISSVCPSLSDSVHLGTRGCICDFTSYLSEARIKVLGGFVCSYCCSELESCGLTNLVDELEFVLGKDWLGKPTDPSTPSGIASNLGYNLFITKGLTTTRRERLGTLLTEEVLKQFIANFCAIIAGIAIAYFLVRFGLTQK